MKLTPEMKWKNTSHRFNRPKVNWWRIFIRLLHHSSWLIVTLMVRPGDLYHNISIWLEFTKIHTLEVTDNMSWFSLDQKKISKHIEYSSTHHYYWSTHFPRLRDRFIHWKHFQTDKTTVHAADQRSERSERERYDRLNHYRNASTMRSRRSCTTPFESIRMSWIENTFTLSNNVTWSYIIE